MTIKVMLCDRVAKPALKLADVELRFDGDEGLLDHFTLTGVAVWGWASPTKTPRVTLPANLSATLAFEYEESLKARILEAYETAHRSDVARRTALEVPGRL